jgi:hypothetical protein
MRHYEDSNYKIKKKRRQQRDTAVTVSTFSFFLVTSMRIILKCVPIVTKKKTSKIMARMGTANFAKRNLWHLL